MQGGEVAAEPQTMSPLANDVAQSANDVADASDVAAMPQMAGARPAMQFDLD